MKKVFIAPLLLALSLSLIACGKKDSNNNAGPIGVPAPIVVNPTPTVPNTGNFAFDCNALGGSVTVINSQNVCQFTKVYNIGLHQIGNIHINTGITVYPYSHIYINASESIDTLINGIQIGHGNQFTANSYGGTLGFKGDDLFDSYSVYTVQITAAYNESLQYVSF